MIFFQKLKAKVAAVGFYEDWKKANANGRERLAAKAAFGIEIEAQTQRIVKEVGGRRKLEMPPSHTKYESLPSSLKDKLEADGVEVSIKKLPRSTLSIATLTKGKRILVSPAMPEKEAIIFAGTEWYQASPATISR